MQFQKSKPIHYDDIDDTFQQSKAYQKKAKVRCYRSRIHHKTDKLCINDIPQITNYEQLICNQLYHSNPQCYSTQYQQNNNDLNTYIKQSAEQLEVPGLFKMPSFVEQNYHKFKILPKKKNYISFTDLLDIDDLKVLPQLQPYKVTKTVDEVLANRRNKKYFI